jgi:hypothetical protein
MSADPVKIRVVQRSNAIARLDLDGAAKMNRRSLQITLQSETQSQRVVIMAGLILGRHSGAQVADRFFRPSLIHQRNAEVVLILRILRVATGAQAAVAHADVHLRRVRDLHVGSLDCPVEKQTGAGEFALPEQLHRAFESLCLIAGARLPRERTGIRRCSRLLQRRCVDRCFPGWNGRWARF